MTARVTLITGASSGIGAELAKVFAARGHRVALAARRADRLDALAAELGDRGAGAPIVIPCDVSDQGAIAAIDAALAAAGVAVDHLVNNAGYGLFGRFDALDADDQLGMIDVNIRALTALTLHHLDSLVQHRGGILNVASVAGFMPGPGMAVYYATKAYVLSLTEALHCELAPRGVRVTALCPGPVPTEFQTRAGIEPGLDSAVLNVAPDEVARQAYDGLMRNRRVVLPGIGIKLVPRLLRLFPRGVVLAGVGRIQQRRA